MERSCSLFEERCRIGVRGHCGSCAPGGAGITRIVSVRLLRWCPGICSVGLLCLLGLFCACCLALGWLVGLSLRVLWCFFTGDNCVGLVCAVQCLLVCLHCLSTVVLGVLSFRVLCGRAKCVRHVCVGIWCQELERLPASALC